MDELDRLKEKLQRFNKERNWDQFHSPKNLAMALSVEASEIVEIFQWITEEKAYDLDGDKLALLKEEIGDVFLYLQLLASKYNIDLIDVPNKKLKKNDKKYPKDKAKGSSKKYTEL